MHQLLALLLLFICQGSCEFRDAFSKWPAESCSSAIESGSCSASDLFDCPYELIPIQSKADDFGAEIHNIDLKSLSQLCAHKLIQDAMMYRFLVFPRQKSMTWQDQIHFTEVMGDGKAFPETIAPNRKFHPKVPDKRLGFFSNDPDEGLMYQGTEGWHVDGNTVEMPHTFTIIHCISANKNGPTLLVPLREIVEMLSTEERSLLDQISFVSSSNDSIQHPLIYKHPVTHEDTIMLALGSLSGQYLKTEADGAKRVMSLDETQFIQDILEAKILGSNIIHSHHWKSGDLLLLNNPSLSHFAGPGSQGSFKVTGLRLMHRTTVGGSIKPTKQTGLNYVCRNHAPFQDQEYCLFSLKKSLFYPRFGEFETLEQQRQRCKNVHKSADLALIPNEIWNDEAASIISKMESPHWINATNPKEKEILWEIPLTWINGKDWTFSKWHQPSRQPNDHDVEETCIFIGPDGHWFDLTCGPKIHPGADPGPVIQWEDGHRYKFNVYPLCGIFKKDL